MNKYNEIWDEIKVKVQQYYTIASAKYMAYKKISIPASVAVGVLLLTWIATEAFTEPKPIKSVHEKFTPEKISLDNALANKAKFERLMKSENNGSQGDRYLQGINNMSKQLNYLSLQNEVIRQKVKLASAILLLKKSGIKIPASFADSSTDMDDTGFDRKSPLRISIIYQENGIYKADLKINGTDVTVKKGSTVNGNYKVNRIDPTAVRLVNTKDNTVKTLSISDQMRSI